MEIVGYKNGGFIVKFDNGEEQFIEAQNKEAMCIKEQKMRIIGWDEKGKAIWKIIPPEEE